MSLHFTDEQNRDTEDHITSESHTAEAPAGHLDPEKSYFQTTALITYTFKTQTERWREKNLASC
jgi:hypothetical protein